MNVWRRALWVVRNRSNPLAADRQCAAGRPKALCSRMPILPWTQTRRNRQGTPAGQCRRVPSRPGCTLLGPAPRIPSSGHAVFCSSARTGAVAGHHFSSGGQRNIGCNSIVVPASCLSSKPGIGPPPFQGPAARLFREGVIAFFLAAPRSSAGRSVAGVLGRRRRSRSSLAAKNPGVVEVRGLAVRVFQYRLS
jgi:hypothetical protein